MWYGRRGETEPGGGAGSSSPPLGLGAPTATARRYYMKGAATRRRALRATRRGYEARGGSLEAPRRVACEPACARVRGSVQPQPTRLGARNLGDAGPRRPARPLASLSDLSGFCPASSILIDQLLIDQLRVLEHTYKISLSTHSEPLVRSSSCRHIFPFTCSTTHLRVPPAIALPFVSDLLGISLAPVVEQRRWDSGETNPHAPRHDGRHLPPDSLLKSSTFLHVSVCSRGRWAAAYQRLTRVSGGAVRRRVRGSENGQLHE